jgi:flagellar hook assembly protein FlgD
MGERTTLSFVVPANGTTVDLAVFDAEGRRIRQLVRNRLDAGPISLTWDGRDLGGRRVESGVYFGRLSFDGKSESQRLTIVR